jgi:transmembrane sensor
MRTIDDDLSPIERQAQAWLLRLRSGHATSEDARAFKRWYDEDPAHAKAARKMWGVWRRATAAGAEFAQQSVPVAGPSGHREYRPSRRSVLIGGAALAGATWLALRPPLQLWPGVNELAADYRTGTGEQRRVVLADRVVVEMNTQTRFNMRGSEGVLEGIELLAGEAEVSTGTQSSMPFNVVAGNGRLSVGQARFDVCRLENEVRVTCLTGSVGLQHPRGRATLGPSQQVVYRTDSVDTVTLIDSASVTAWRQGLLVFDDAPLTQVIDEINRYRPGRIILRNPVLGTNRVQAKFSIHRLDDVITLMHLEYGARVTSLPGNIVLLS